MADRSVARKLVAILVADVVGYSRLVGADEEGTIARLRSLREEVIDPSIAKHGGRIVKTMGDGLLVEFASVVNAARFAVEVQLAMADRNADLPGDQRIEFRIGINLGDIVVEGDDILGDGVNVAARLEGLATPGGICISDRVYADVYGKLEVGFEDLGEQELKNIAELVRVYRILLDPAQAGAVIGKTGKARSRWTLTAAAAVLLVVIAGGALWWFKPWAPAFEPASVERMAYPLPDRPSIAVLPFDNYSDDPRMDFFVSGLTEDLTAALSKIYGIFVIARNSAASYKGKSFNIKQVAEELGVQYVLEGSVQKEGERLRITVQLVDALNGRHLWAERFDRSTSDVFAVQDEITLRVSTEMQVKLTEGDRARIASQDTRNIDSWLLTTEGFAEFYNFTREGMIRARELWESAQAADPNHATPVGGIGLTHWYEARRGWSASREESLRLATKFAERAIEMGPTNPIGYQALGNILILRNEPERAIEIRRKAIKLAPNDFSTVAGLASQLMYLGQEQEAVELFEHSLRLSPKPPWWVPANYGIALHLVGRKQESVDSLKEAIGLSPKNTGLRAQLAAVYTDLGHMDKAMIEAAEVLRINSNFTISSYKKSRRFQDPRRIAWLKDLMIRAGLPE